LVLRGIMGNAERMPAIGTAVNRHLVVAYSVAAALAGAAGALLAQTTQFVALDALSFNRSAELLLILAFGGSGTLYGALLGTIAFMLAHQLLSELNPQYWEFWLGVILVAVVLFARGGIMGGLVRMRNTVARRRHD
jgi:branched-chain amino acid transport system permease protein